MSDVKPTYCYAMLMRPPAPGAIPREGLIEAIPFESAVSGSGHRIWGKATYSRELTQKEIDDYELELCGTMHGGWLENE